MPVLWVYLPKAWDLADVQALWTVVVSVISSSFAFVYTRLCWQNGAKIVLRNRSAPLGALLSINTLGEVYDACRLLRMAVLSSFHWQIWSQCVVVSALTLTTFLSGPIVRYSTHWAPRNIVRPVAGLLASRSTSGINYETLLWNTTFQSLDNAGFPHDQLLDYLPEATEPWQYVPSDWNSSWHMDCNYSKESHLSLTVVDTACNENTTLSDQIPALESIYPENAMYASDRAWTYTKFEGFQYDNYTWSSLFMFRTGYNFLKHTKDYGTWDEIDLTFVFMYMQGVHGTPVSEEWCDFSAGPVQAASYSKAFCKLRKTGKTLEGQYNADIAYPDNDSLQYLAQAYIEYYMARLSRSVVGGAPMTTINPKDLVRFYQVYLVSQDTQTKHPVRRPLNVKVQVVQMSTIFIAVCTLFAVFSALGMAAYLKFWIRHRSYFHSTPQSKIDWMIQAVEGGISRTARLSTEDWGRSGGQKVRYSVTSVRSTEPGPPTKDRRKSDFESATYSMSSLAVGTRQPANMLSRQSSQGSYFPLVQRSPQPEVSDVSLVNLGPTTPAGPLNYEPEQTSFRADVMGASQVGGRLL